MKTFLIALGIVLLIVIVGVAFYFFAFGKLTISSPSPTSVATPAARPTNSDAVTPDTVAQEFFVSYVGCLLNPPPAASGKISQYCQVSTGYTTQDFAQNLAAGGVLQSGKDPVTCSDVVPQGYTFQTQSATADVAFVIATEGFGGNGEKQVTISMAKENDHWLVANIICPTTQ